MPAVSKVTLASLADIGFEIDYIMAEPYALPAPMQIQTPPRSCVNRRRGGLRKSIRGGQAAGMTPFVNGC